MAKWNSYNGAVRKMNTTKLWQKLIETHFSGTHPSWRLGTGSEKGVDLNSPPPPRLIAEGQLMHFLCALDHARTQMVISPQSLACYPPLELLLPHQAEAYLSTLSWIPFGCRKTGGLHIKAHHNSVVLPQVSLGGSVTWLTHFMHHPIQTACDPSSFFCSIKTP